MMIYYVRFDDNPDNSTYKKWLSLHRWYETDGILMLERWEKENKRWVDNPRLLDATGIGGAHNYVKLTRAQSTKAKRQFGAG